MKNTTGTNFTPASTNQKNPGDVQPITMMCPQGKKLASKDRSSVRVRRHERRKQIMRLSDFQTPVVPKVPAVMNWKKTRMTATEGANRRSSHS